MEGSRELPSIIRFDLWFDFPLIVITKIYYPKLLGAEQPHWIQTITSQSHFQGYYQKISELFLKNRSSIINSDKKVWWFLTVELAVQSCMLIIWLWFKHLWKLQYCARISWDTLFKYPWTDPLLSLRYQNISLCNNNTQILSDWIMSKCPWLTASKMKKQVDYFCNYFWNSSLGSLKADGF